MTVVVGGGGLAEGAVSECPRLVKMLSVCRCLGANAHDFALVFGDVMAVFGREVSRTCRRSRWRSCRRGCSNLQTLRWTLQRFVESPDEIVEGETLVVFVSNCETWVAEQTHR